MRAGMAGTIRISDPHDPRIAAYRDIRERDLVGREGLFIAEGKVVLDTLLDATGFGLSSILLLENRLAGLTETLAKAPAAAPVYVAAPPVMDAIAGFHIHRGILAIGRRKTPPATQSLLADLPENALILALVGIANHDNIGAIFRNATAFGVDAVLLDPTCCDPLYRKAIRVSVGGVFRTPFAAYASVEAMLADLMQAEFDMIALSPRSAVVLRDIVPRRRAALFLGAEGGGLPSGLLARLRTARIPMAEGFDSLNVATAAAIALYHFASSGSVA